MDMSDSGAIEGLLGPSDWTRRSTAVRSSPASVANVAFVMNGITGEQLGPKWDLAGHVHTLAVHPEGRYAVFTFREGFIQAYDLKTRARSGGTPLAGQVRWSSVSPDGNTLYVRSENDLDQEIAAVDPITGLPVGPSISCIWGSRVTASAFHPNNRVVALGDLDGVVRFLECTRPNDRGRQADPLRSRGGKPHRVDDGTSRDLAVPRRYRGRGKTEATST